MVLDDTKHGLVSADLTLHDNPAADVIGLEGLDFTRQARLHLANLTEPHLVHTSCRRTQARVHEPFAQVAKLWAEHVSDVTARAATTSCASRCGEACPNHAEAPSGIEKP